MKKSMEISILKQFPTPLGFFRIPETTTVNTGLEQLILAAEQRSPSTGRTNVGGWRSNHDLLEWPGVEVATLSGWIHDAVGRMIGATAGEAGFKGMMKIHGWANVLRRGNYNTLHTHPESAWSGVYYVCAGSENPSDPQSGLLEFRDPRPFVEMMPAPGYIFGQPLRIQPEAGLMVMFPSWLYHMVHPYYGDGARIAIAFNVSIQHATDSAAVSHRLSQLR